MRAYVDTAAGTHGANLDRLADDARPATDLLTLLATYREGLTRERSLVEHCTRAQQCAIHGHDLAGEDQQGITCDHLRCRHIGDGFAPVQMGHGGRTRRERGELAPGAAEGALFEQLATREHQRNNEAREQFAQQERTHHREQRDDICAQLAVQDSATH